MSLRRFAGPLGGFQASPFPIPPFELNRNAPEAYGLISVFSPWNNLIDFAGGIQTTPANAPDLITEEFGIVAKTFSATARWDFNDGSRLAFESGSQDFSIFAWVKFVSGPTIQAICDKRDGNDDGWRFVYVTNTFWLQVDAVDIKASSNINDGNYHLIGAVVDRDGNGQMYLDGQADGTPVAIGSEVMSIAQAFVRVGNDRDANEWRGRIGDIYFFDVAKTAKESLQLYRNWRNIYAPVPRRFVVVVPAVGGDLSISVSDGVTVTDTPTMLMTSFVDESEAISVADTGTPNLENNPSVSDAITVGEAVNLTLVHTISVSDSITVADVDTAHLENNPLVSDAITVGDTGTPNLENNPLVSDGVSVADSPTITLVTGLSISVAESISVGEAVTMLVTSFVDVAEAISVADVDNVALVHTTSVSDAITAADTGTPHLENNPLVSDGITVADTPTVYTELNINTSDGITVGEAVTVNVITAGTLTVSVSDGITVGESVTMLVTSFVDVAEAISVADVPALAVENNPLVSDAITVGESVTVISELNVSTSESIALTDTPAVLLPELFTSVSDAITVTDSPTVSVAAPGTLLQLSISESITVTEITYIAFILGTIDLTLRARSTSLTLESRGTDLTLKTRSTNLTLKTR